MEKDKLFAFEEIRVVVEGVSPLVYGEGLSMLRIDLVDGELEHGARQELLAAAHAAVTQTPLISVDRFVRALELAHSKHRRARSLAHASFTVSAAVHPLDQHVAVYEPDTPSMQSEPSTVNIRKLVHDRRTVFEFYYSRAIEQWAATFRMRVNGAVLPTDFARQLLEEAGATIGIGCDGSADGGSAARFRVVSWEARPWQAPWQVFPGD